MKRRRLVFLGLGHLFRRLDITILQSMRTSTYFGLDVLNLGDISVPILLVSPQLIPCLPWSTFCLQCPWFAKNWVAYGRDDNRTNQTLYSYLSDPNLGLFEVSRKVQVKFWVGKFFNFWRGTSRWTTMQTSNRLTIGILWLVLRICTDEYLDRWSVKIPIMDTRLIAQHLWMYCPTLVECCLSSFNNSRTVCGLAHILDLSIRSNIKERPTFCSAR